jgi:hypothetical protein
VKKKWVQCPACLHVHGSAAIGYHQLAQCRTLGPGEVFAGISEGCCLWGYRKLFKLSWGGLRSSPLKMHDAVAMASCTAGQEQRATLACMNKDSVVSDGAHRDLVMQHFAHDLPGLLPSPFLSGS